MSFGPNCLPCPPLCVHTAPTDNIVDTYDSPLSNNIIDDPPIGSSFLLKPSQPLNLGFFSVCAFMQMSQQMYLKLMVDSLAVDVRCINKT